MATSALHSLRSHISRIKADGFGLSAVREYQLIADNAGRPNDRGLIFRLVDTISRAWYLGVTAFGGPPAHFQILHNKFVKERERKPAPWIDEQTYHELFAICQALPGPASTKMLLCLVFYRAGFTCAIVAFLLWSLPAATVMYGLSLAISHVGNTLPSAVYSLLSGLNSATVGIIALAAIQLAQKAISDPLSRILVIVSACAGICYSALWYFPTMLAIGGLMTAVFDVYARRLMRRLRTRFRSPETGMQEESNLEPTLATSTNPVSSQPREGLTRRMHVGQQDVSADVLPSHNDILSTRGQSSDANPHGISTRTGLLIISTFMVTFIAVMVIRATVDNVPRPFSIFANMYLAGTIICGGGPVVIPLLRDYVVQPGWVSPRDFLIGLAVIQAMPGPNFNFAVYLGALAARSAGVSAIAGAILGFLGIYVPGLVLAIGVQGLWRRLRTKPLVIGFLRGVNATAVGIVFSAVYRLWTIGYLSADRTSGQNLGLKPWWVVVAAVSYSSSAWFHVPPAVAIISGGALGLLWYAAVGRH